MPPRLLTLSRNSKRFISRPPLLPNLYVASEKQVHAMNTTRVMLQWATWLERVHNWIYTHLADYGDSGHTGRGWFGYLRRDGTVFNACKGGNYKGSMRSLYLWSSVFETHINIIAGI